MDRRKILSTNRVLDTSLYFTLLYKSHTLQQNALMHVHVHCCIIFPMLTMYEEMKI